MLQYRVTDPATGQRVKRAETIADAEGPNRLSRREAERAAADRIGEVDRQNVRPSTGMAIRDFVERYFRSQVVVKKKPAGQKHYRYMLDLVLPMIGERRLCDVAPIDIENLIADVLEAGYAPETAKKAKFTLSAVFKHAIKLRFYADGNPAQGVEIPESRSPKRPTYSIGQARRVLGVLASPVLEMAYLSIVTSMNASEMTGLRRKWVNLTGNIVEVEGEAVGPYSIAVREHYYEGRYGTLKAGKRYRILPLDETTAEMLKRVMADAIVQDAEAPVFQSRRGTPIDTHNVSNRIFRPLAKKFGFSVTWHGFRRMHSSMAGQLTGIPIEDRVATMGHGDARMTLHYSVEDIERRRKVPQGIMRLLLKDEDRGSNYAQ